MTNAILISHGPLAESLLDTAKLIAGTIEGVSALSVGAGMGIDDIREMLSTEIDTMDSGDGVIVFTDMLGGTPTNVALTLMSEKNIEVVAGVNLPLLMKFTTLRKKKIFGEVVTDLKSYGPGTISIAGEILKGDK